MGLTPISSICEVGKVSVSRADHDSATPLALDRSSRTDDDRHSEAREEEDRGMEDEGAGADEAKQAEETLSSSAPDSAVDFFA
jgi:hypothetical protein